MPPRTDVALAWASRQAAWLLFGGVLLGLLWPDLAAWARPLMLVAVFAFTTAAFLQVDGRAARAQAARPQPWRWRWVLAWVAFGVPLVTWAVVSVLPIPAAMKTGMLLCMLAPPVCSAAAMAAMCGGCPALALVCTVRVSLLCPLLLPAAAQWLAAVPLHIDGPVLALRLLVLVGGAAALATALRRYAAGWVESHPQAPSAASVLGLIVVAIGAMHGMRVPLLQHGGDVAAALAAAFALNAGLLALGAALFARLGAREALTVGLVSGNRNVTLMGAACAPWLGAAPEVHLFIVASVFPIFLLPWPMARLLAGGRRAAALAHRRRSRP